jgi:hypothetical protein
MSDNGTPQQPPQPHIFGEVEPDELQRLAGLKQQADGLIHQMGVNRVNEHRLIMQLSQCEQATNEIVKVAGDRLGIPNGTAWSVTSDGKAVSVGPQPTPSQMRPNLSAVSTPDAGEDTTPEA